MSLELNGIITIDKLARYHQKIAEKYASTSDLENYATEEYVNEAIANIEHPLPEVSANHQYLTTNEKGEKIWEDKLAYTTIETIPFVEEAIWDGTQTSFPEADSEANAGDKVILYIDDIPYYGTLEDNSSHIWNIKFDEEYENSWINASSFYVSKKGYNMNLGGAPLRWAVGKMSIMVTTEVVHYLDNKYIDINIEKGAGENSMIINSDGSADGIYSMSLSGGSASGFRSIAIGNSYAFGDYSFSAANGSAKAKYSVAFGEWTDAVTDHSMTIGTHNITDENKEYLFIIGNGERGEFNPQSGYQRILSNAHTVNKDGTGWFQKEIKIGGSDEHDENAKTVATEEYVINAISQIEIPEASANVNVYEITSDSAVLDELIALLPEGIEIHSGDVMLVTNSMGVKSAYQYDEDWIACDGNVDASKVIMPFDITLAGSYTQVGNLSKTSTGTATFATKGKSVAQALQEMLSKREQPKIKSNPSVSLTATSGAKEVGTKITPEWSASLNAGSYTYGPATGITASSWEISDTDGNKASTASGKFTEITVGDTTNYRITAKANYGAGAVAVDNLGDPSNPTIQIAAGSKSANGGYITGYRAWFTYIGESLDTINSAFIRGTTNKGSTPATQNDVNIPAGTKRVMIAIPATSSLALKQVIDVDGMGLDVFGNFTLQTVSVEGLNGYEAKSYNVWVAENINGMAATHYNFIIG